MGGSRGGSTGGSINTGSSAPTLDVTTETRGYSFAHGHQDFTTTQYAYNATITRTAVGTYQVAFTTPHPAGDEYPVVLGQEEDANRDVPKVHIPEGSMSSTGFTVLVTVDDNATTADFLIDEPWSFSALHEETFVTDVQLV